MSFHFLAETEISAVESLRFDFSTIEAATQKFSEANKLGEGGFGEVYKACTMKLAPSTLLLLYYNKEIKPISVRRSIFVNNSGLASKRTRSGCQETL